MADNNYMDPQDFNANSRLRASDADRDTAAAVINNALAEGRLTAEEHSARLDAIYAAKTHADLVPLLDDLPGQRTAPATPAWQGRAGRIVAIFGGASRKGAWHVDPVINVFTVFGGAELDFREAVLPGRQVILKAISVLGGVQVTVPPEMRVVDNGVAILGGREIAGNPDEAAHPDAPVLRIEGACVLGGIEVKRKPRKRGKDRTGPAGGVAGPFYGSDVLGQIRDTRREVHDQIRDARREVHDQIRDARREVHREIRTRRRQIRRGWSGEGED